eukprot:4612299-Pleurochrysis_carterae.AAC.1
MQAVVHERDTEREAGRGKTRDHGERIGRPGKRGRQERPPGRESEMEGDNRDEQGRMGTKGGQEEKRTGEKRKAGKGETRVALTKWAIPNRSD